MKKLCLILIVFILFNFTYSLNCDKVASMPENYSVLLPKYETLSRVHLQNYFFIHNGENGDIKISIKEKSILKLLITPKHSDIIFKISGGEISKEIHGVSGIPFAYTNMEMPAGEYSVTLMGETIFSNGQEVRKEDSICNDNYVIFESYIEKYNNFQERIGDIKKASKDLENWNFDFDDLKLKIPADTEMEGNKISLKLVKQHESKNRTILREFDINIPEIYSKEGLVSQNNSTKPEEDPKKFEFRMTIFSDFLFGGSMVAGLVRSKEISSLLDFSCVSNESCFISERHDKNSLVLHNILGPGDYKLVLFDVQQFIAIKKIRKAIQDIPITTQYFLKEFTATNDAYNCDGRALPSTFNTNDLLDKNQKHFEYNGDIMINSQSLSDSIDFQVIDDSLLRVVTFHEAGNKIDLSLWYESVIANPSITSRKPEYKKFVIEQSAGKSDGIYVSLKRNVKYRLIFNYHNSLFSGANTSCETFYLRLGIISVEYQKEIAFNNQPAGQCPKNVNAIENAFSQLKEFHDKKIDGKKQTTNQDITSTENEFNHFEENLIVTLPNENLKDFEPLYSRSFDIVKPMILYIEILNEFVPNFVVPIITTRDKSNPIKYEFDKITYHESYIKLTLEKGSYDFIIMNSKMQYDNNDEEVTNYLAKNLYPRCKEFQIRIKAIRLNTKRLKNWECNNTFFDLIPDTINTIRDLGLSGKNKEVFTYYSNDVLLPRNTHKLAMKTKDAAIIRVNVEQNKDYKMKITLNKNNKILKTATQQKYKLFTSKQEHIIYYLKANTEYILEFAHETALSNSQYFSHCHKFKLHIEYVTKEMMSRLVNAPCTTSTPKITDVIYERLIGVKNSYYNYGTKNILQLFTYRTLKQKFTGSDIEKEHSNKNVFDIKLDKSKPYIHEYEFDVKSSVTKANVILETPYGRGTGFTAIIRTEDKKGGEVIGSSEMVGEGIVMIKDLNLDYGKFVLEIIENSYNKNINNKFPSCNHIYLAVLLENRPYDYISKSVTRHYETCDIPTLPQRINLPGWLNVDTAFTINQLNKFKLSDEKQYVELRLLQKSVFRIFFPDNKNNIKFLAKLYKLKKNSNVKQLLANSRDTIESINIVLEKGSYELQLSEYSADDSKLKEKGKCNAFEMYTSILPVNHIEGKTLEYNGYCNNYDKINAQPNSEKYHLKLQAAKQGQDYNKGLIYLNPSPNTSTFLAEIIMNPLLDSNYEVKVYSDEKTVNSNIYKQSGTEFMETTIESIYNENFVWINFKPEKNKAYLIKLIPNSFKNVKNSCETIMFSYVYSEEDILNNDEDREDSLKGSLIREEEDKKEICVITDHLPSSLYKDAEQCSRFGGIQKKDSSLSFHGNFLIPQNTKVIRTSFLMKKNGVAYITVNPNHYASHVEVQVLQNNKSVFFFRSMWNPTYGRNDVNNFIYSKIPASKTPYIVEISFNQAGDRNEVNNCKNYQFAMQIIPEKTYLENNQSCNLEERDKLPKVLEVSKAEEFSYESIFNLDNKFNKFKKTKEGNYEYSIKLENKSAFSLSIVLKYLLIENSMDMVLIDKNTNEEKVLENTYEDLVIKNESEEIIANKKIEADLHKGSFELKLYIKRAFLRVIEDKFMGEQKSMCLSFLLQIEAAKLYLKSDNKVVKKDDIDITDNDVQENDNDSEINEITQDDISDNSVNRVVSVEPISQNNIRLNKSISIDIKYELKMKKLEKIPLDRLKKTVYLKSDKSLDKFYPTEAEVENTRRINYSFDNSKFAKSTCYTLYHDFYVLKEFNKGEFRDFKDDELKHNFCTEKCDCNPKSSYKCSKKGVCKCKPPHTGPKCMECEKGYESKDGECIEQLETICNEKITCNNHGKCLPTKNDKEAECKCDEGFANNGNSFCSVCEDPEMTWPNCNDDKNGFSDEGDNNSSEGFNWTSSCNVKAYSLPKKLYDKSDIVNEQSGGSQAYDGTLNFQNIFKMKSEEEVAKIKITHPSLLRLYYVSKEMNRAKISLLDNLSEENENKEDTVIANTEGQDENESFIVTLDPRDKAYYIRILHLKTKFNCTRYQLKIAIIPIKDLLAELKCKRNNQSGNQLPITRVTAGHQTKNLLEESKYSIHEVHILAKSTKLSKGERDSRFTQAGIVRKAKGESFAYTIQVDVEENPVVLAANLGYYFISNEINLQLRDKNGKLLKVGDIEIPQINEMSDYDFRENLHMNLEPGTYYLTLTQDLAMKDLLLLIKDKYSQKPNNFKKCFNFKLDIETNVIQKSNKNIKTSKFESMFNRVISVEPSSVANHNIEKNLEIFIKFEEAIDPTLKELSKKYKDVFYLENVRSKVRVYPKKAFLEGSRQTNFIILYKPKALGNEECYELKYDLDLLNSRDKDRALTSDAPIIHKYCTKSCDCNPHTIFDCEENSSNCDCQHPYTGKGCYECKKGFIMVNWKCIENIECSKEYCSGMGDCNPTSTPGSLPTCKCNETYTGDKCDKCTDIDKVFPDCLAYEVVKRKNLKSEMSKDKNKIDYDDKEYTDQEKEDKNEIDVQSNRLEKCDFDFVPHSFDTLGYLHLNGHFHISGLFSLKHFEDSHYTTTFTIKERSHVKIYLEHSKNSHVVYMYLIKDSKPVNNGVIYVGPAGIGSSSFLDVIIDPNSKDGKYVPYQIAYFIKDSVEGDNDNSDYLEKNKDLVEKECFNVFMEIQVSTISQELASRQNEKCDVDKTNTLMSTDINLFDYHTIFFKQIQSPQIIMDNYNRNPSKYDLKEVVYFYHEYFYVPDSIDTDLKLELEINSKFLDGQIGIMLEIVEIPDKINGRRIDHKQLTAKILKDIFKDVTVPLCETHCFTAVKKFNSSYLNRVLPPDTIFRIWFYDISPIPQGSNPSEQRKCIQYGKNFTFNHQANKVQKQSNHAICTHAELPKNLNIRGFLGDSSYFQKWGFHVLDNFRIDNTINSGYLHSTFFTLTEYHILRMVIFTGRVDTDLELYILNGNERNMIAKSNAKNFEDALVIELAPGKYEIHYKFFAPPSGYHNCESIRMEFGMAKISLLQENVTRMLARNKLTPNKNILNISEMIDAQKDIFSYEISNNRYTTPLGKAFRIDIDDIKSYKPSIIIEEFEFTIDNKSHDKLELHAMVSSDFLLIDASIYLSENKTKKIISAMHKKNLNVLQSGTLEAGVYSMSIRYYSRMHFNNKSQALESVSLQHATMAEIEVAATMINKSDEEVRLITKNGSITIPPKGEKKVSHNWMCRNSGQGLPSTLNSLRHLEFSTDTHILDTYLIPVLDQGTHAIQFTLKHVPYMMIRVYVECHNTDIDIELVQITGKERKVLAESKQNTHFETISHIIKSEIQYEIVIIFKEAKINHIDCHTFKMEIAVESNHSLACPTDNPKYVELTKLSQNALPTEFPVIKYEGGKRKFPPFNYNSANAHHGDNDGTGYVYLLRSEKDKIIKFKQFSVEKELDFKFELSHDFIQAPINVFLTTKEKGNEDISKFAKNSLKLDASLNESNILAISEIFENRSVLYMKNLPKGEYVVLLYLPGLQTTFLQEKEVCSIYDIMVDAKISKNHFKDRNLISFKSILDDSLDIPTKIPRNLNTFHFEEEGNYLNNINFFRLRSNDAKENNQIKNTIDFELKQNSVVKFWANHETLEEKLSIKLNNLTSSSKMINQILKAGKYQLEILVDRTNPETYKFDDINNSILLYSGIAPLTRLNESYEYNNIQSVSHQCVTSIDFPDRNIEIPDDQIFNYHKEIITINTNDIRGTKTIREFTIHTKESSRIFVDIGADYIFHKINVLIKGRTKEWRTMWAQNYGEIDITVPGGRYDFAIELNDEITHPDLKCIIFGLNIHISYLTHESLFNKALHPHYNFDKTKIKGVNEVGQDSKCKGQVLPFEILPDSESPLGKINEKGEYSLHFNKASYFIHKEVSEDYQNVNEITIRMQKPSLIRVSTISYNPLDFIILPILKTQFEKKKKAVPVNKDIEALSNGNSERNVGWFLHNKDIQDYKLEFIQEVKNESQSQNENKCPNYGLSISIKPLEVIEKNIQCPKASKDNTYEYKLPNKKITKESYKSNKYNEEIAYSYFTPTQYRDNRSNSENYEGFEYIIELEIEKENQINLSLTYEHLYSSFDITLNKVESKDSAFKTRVIGKGEISILPNVETHSKSINQKIEPGKYTITITENIWPEVYEALNSDKEDDDENLCLPFKYSIDLISLEEVSLLPRITSTFPGRGISFIGKDDEIYIKVLLSKPAYSKDHKPITNLSNFMHIVDSFYLTVSNPEKDDEEDKKTKMEPHKVECSDDSKEWQLRFFVKGLNYSKYSLNMNPNILFDIDGKEFMKNVEFPVFKIGSTMNEIFEHSKGDPVDEKKLQIESDDIKKNIKEADKNSDNELKVETKPTKPTNNSNQKSLCKNGKYFFDNIMRKWVCSCRNGYSGKYCDKCYGKEEDVHENGIVIKKCIMDEEDDDDDEDDSEKETDNNGSINYTTNFNKGKVQEITKISAQKDNKGTVGTVETSRIGCGGCNQNGFCDNKTGRCICNDNYMGTHCEKKRTKKAVSNTNWNNNISSLTQSNGGIFSWLFGMLYSLITLLFKIGLVAVGLFILYQCYGYLRENVFTGESSSSSNSSYNATSYGRSESGKRKKDEDSYKLVNSLESGEFEMKDKEKVKGLELYGEEEDEDDNLVDFSINAVDNKSVNSKKQQKSKFNTEL